MLIIEYEYEKATNGRLRSEQDMVTLNIQLYHLALRMHQQHSSLILIEP
jgi:hypothetical protein